eukprot:CAMPEP_0177620964 /NCGR_PEP_ID=MMETSP0419_2-20121207/27268_1 /TAXON_ID=582737 /ORGANISM="Tetraselmis sp., Strain GSL018" /LENGTH=37 /DNA_ID= /DNA_START= /DNA_END= /DNA_ORIENTATION=
MERVTSCPAKSWSLVARAWRTDAAVWAMENRSVLFSA